MSEDDSIVRRRITDYSSRRDQRSSNSENQTLTPSSSRKTSKETLTPLTPDRKTKKFSFDLSTSERSPSPKPLLIPQYKIKIQTEEDSSDTEEMNKDGDIKDAVFVTEPTTPLDDAGNKNIENETVPVNQEKSLSKEGDKNEKKESLLDTKNKDTKITDKSVKPLETEVNKKNDDKKSEGTNKKVDENVKSQEVVTPDNEPDAVAKDTCTPTEPVVPRTPTYSMTSLSDEEDFDRLEDAVITENGDDEVVINNEESGGSEETESESEETFFGKYGCVLFCSSLVTACVAVIAMYLNKSKS